jgi:hypothetical protein
MATIHDVEQTMNELDAILVRFFGASGTNLSAKLGSAEGNLGARNAQLIQKLDTEYQALTSSSSPAATSVDKLDADAREVLNAIKTLETRYAAFRLQVPPKTPLGKGPGIGTVLMIAVGALIAFAMFSR